MPESAGSWKLLADENISLDVVKPLKKAGYDVTICPKGLKNGELYRRIVSEKIILFTHDKDFLDSGRYPASKTAGIIFIPIHPPTDKNVLPSLKNMLETIAPGKISGKLAILTNEGVTIRPDFESVSS